LCGKRVVVHDRPFLIAQRHISPKSPCQQKK
jgi:hypothetical protein